MSVQGRPVLWDVVVVGSGPAGSAAAIAAKAYRPNASVLLLDRSDFPRDKCCGDAVLADAFEELAEVGVATEPLVRGYAAVRDFSLTSARGTTVRRRLPDAMTVVPRLVLDARLLQAARDAGAEWRRHSVRSVRQYADHVQVDDAINARILIGADGAESVVRRALDHVRRPNMAVAIRGYDRRGARDHRDDVPTMVLDDRRGMSYAWRFPITPGRSGDGRANVGYGHEVSARRPASRTHLISMMQRLLPEVDVAPATLQAHRLPLASSRTPAAWGRVLLVGDAASLVNPVTGEGIYYAISSGLAAGQAAVGDPGQGSAGAADGYRRTLRARYARHHRHVEAISRLIEVERVLEAGIRAASDHQHAFDDIARLGLGEGRITPSLLGRIGAAMLRPSP